MNCSYCKCYRNTILHGWGNPKSSVFIIGEAPGHTELVKKEPFCGPAGKILEQALEELGLKKSDFWVTNTVCYTPTKDGKMTTPSQTEINSCKDHIVDEINKIQPKALITLGTTATQAITGISNPITQMRGNIYASLPSYNSLPVYPSWHPSYILRGKIRKELPTLISDLKNAFIEVGIIKRPSNNSIFREIKYPEAIEWIQKAKESKELLAFDIETTGGNPKESEIIGISFCYNEEESVYIHLKLRDIFGVLNKVEYYDELVTSIKDILCSYDNPKTAFNDKYEKQVCYFEWGIEIVRIVADAMLMHYLLNEEDKLPSLDFMEKFHFAGVKTLKSELKSTHISDYSLFDPDKLAIYGAEDSYYTRKITIIKRKELEQVQGYAV